MDKALEGGATFPSLGHLHETGDRHVASVVILCPIIAYPRGV
jgi:hypothetical protein